MDEVWVPFFFVLNFSVVFWQGKPRKKEVYRDTDTPEANMIDATGMALEFRGCRAQQRHEGYGGSKHSGHPASDFYGVGTE